MNMKKTERIDYIKTLFKVSRQFNKIRFFTATNRVDSMAIGPIGDRIICEPGDKIEVVRWVCFNGPTCIKVRGKRFSYREFCIPFSWVKEMGAPEELASYMPFAPQTWPQAILTEIRKLNLKSRRKRNGQFTRNN